MPEASPVIPGLEAFDPRLRMPFPENFPGTHVTISTERDIYIGIVPFSEAGLLPALPAELTPEQSLWEKAQGLTSARALMRDAKAVFWGAPEGTFALVVSDKRRQDLGFYLRSFSARLNITGKVCLTRSGNVGLVRSYPETFSHPVTSDVPSSYDDAALEVAAGSYVVTVSQMFRWQNAQFAQTNQEFVHYHIAIRSMPADSPGLMSEIPWLSLQLPT